jgi:hypothetical protein
VGKAWHETYASIALEGQSASSNSKEAEQFSKILYNDEQLYNCDETLYYI